MAYKLINETRKDFNIKNVEEERRDELKGYVETIKQGEIEIVPTWELVDELLEIFPENEEWRIEELRNGMFAILPLNSARAKNQTFQQNKLIELLNE